MTRMLRRGLLALLVLLLSSSLLLAPSAHASKKDWNGNRKVVAAAAVAPVTPAACTIHYKGTNALQWDASNAYSYRSDSGWYRSIWDWDSCYGGFYFKVVFDVDCKLKYWEGRVNPDGSFRYWVLLGTRGATCNARPGTLRLMLDGTMRTYSGAGTLLSNTGSGGSPYRWEFSLDFSVSQPYVQERVMGWCSPCGDYIGVWYGPSEKIQLA